MTYALRMHKFKCQYQLRCYVPNRLFIQGPIFVYVVIEITIVHIVDQKVQVFLVLETAYYFDEETTIRQNLKYVSFTKDRVLLSVLQDLLLAELL